MYRFLLSVGVVLVTGGTHVAQAQNPGKPEPVASHLSAGNWRLGFKNSDGSQNTLNTADGSLRLGFKNSDGSQNTLNTADGSWEFGFQNSDGSQNVYRTPRYRNSE